MLAGTQKPMLGMKLNIAHPLAKGLRGCWLFNEGLGNVAYDTSGYANHGTLENMAFPSTTTSGWNPGKDGVGLTFDGSTDYINCGNDPSLDITDAITIEEMVKATPPHLNNFGGIWFDKYNTDRNRIYARDNGDVAAQFVIGGTDEYVGAGVNINNQWAHVVLTYNGENLKLYINSVEKDSEPASGSVTLSSKSRLIGKGQDDISGFYFNGSIDGVKIYNRALSAEEIKWLYHEPYAMFERGELLL